MIKDVYHFIVNADSSGWIIPATLDSIINPPTFVRVAILIFGLYLVYFISEKGPRRFATRRWVIAAVAGVAFIVLLAIVTKL